MFATQLGSVAEESDTIYLRPETAQGIFVISSMCKKQEE
jgi:glycyl-tRNA synthetase